MNLSFVANRVPTTVPFPNRSIFHIAQPEVGYSMVKGKKLLQKKYVRRFEPKTIRQRTVLQIS